MKLFRVLSLCIFLLLNTFPMLAQEEGNTRVLNPKEIEAMKQKVPLSQDTLRLIKYGSIYMQSAAAAALSMQAYRMRSDAYFTGGNTNPDARASIWIYSYPMAHAIGLNLLTMGRDVFPANAHLFVGNLSARSFVHAEVAAQHFRETQTDLPAGYFIAASALGLTEGYISYFIGRKKKLDYASAMAWTGGNAWGAFLTMEWAQSIQRVRNQDLGVYTQVGLGMLGSLGGIVASSAYHKKHPRTTGDYRAIHAGAVGLAVYSRGLFRQIDSGGHPIGNYARISSAAVTSIGVGVAYLLTKNTDMSDVEGLIIYGGTLTGGLVGALRASTLERTREFSAPVYPQLSWGVGMMIGWGLSYAVVMSFRNSSTGRIGFKVPDIRFHPAALAWMNSSPENQLQWLQYQAAPPLIQMSWSL